MSSLLLLHTLYPFPHSPTHKSSGISQCILILECQRRGDWWGSWRRFTNWECYLDHRPKHSIRYRFWNNIGDDSDDTIKNFLQSSKKSSEQRVASSPHFLFFFLWNRFAENSNDFWSLWHRESAGHACCWGLDTKYVGLWLPGMPLRQEERVSWFSIHLPLLELAVQ